MMLSYLEITWKHYKSHIPDITIILLGTFVFSHMNL